VCGTLCEAPSVGMRLQQRCAHSSQAGTHAAPAL
jgi:hypothetical protein